MNFQWYTIIVIVYALVYVSVYAFSCFRWRKKISPRTKFYEEKNEVFY